MAKKILYFGSLNRKLIFPVLAAFFYFVIMIDNDYELYLIKYLISKKGVLYGTHIFVESMCMFIAEFTTIVLYVIQNKTSKRYSVMITIPKKNEATNNALSYVIIAGLIVLLSLLDFSAFILAKFILFKSPPIKNTFSLLFILIIIGLSVLILNTKYYRHHAVGIFIISFGLIIHSITDFSFIKGNHIIFELFCMLCSDILPAVQDVLEKYLMVTKFVDLFLMLACEGIAGIVLVTISSLLFANKTCTFENYYDFCVNEAKIDNIKYALKFIRYHYQYIIYYSVKIISLICYNIFRILTNFHYTPAHFVIYNTMLKVMVFIYNLVKPLFIEDQPSLSFKEVLGTSIAYIIEMFGVAVFLELMIIGIWGINKNIESEIMKREIEEFDSRKEGLLSQNENSINNTSIHNEMISISNKSIE